MSTRTDLTETQEKRLNAALAHPQGRLVFPDTLRGGARQKVINPLAADDLIAADGEGWCLTEGYAAMGFAPPDMHSDDARPLDDTVPTRDCFGASAVLLDENDGGDPTDEEIAASHESCPEIEAAVAAVEAQAAPKPHKTREGSKQATVVLMLQRPEGATLEQLAEATGWHKHTVRGCLAGALKKKLGLTITSAKGEDGARLYRAA